MRSGGTRVLGGEHVFPVERIANRESWRVCVLFLGEADKGRDLKAGERSNTTKPMRTRVIVGREIVAQGINSQEILLRL